MRSARARAWLRRAEQLRHSRFVIGAGAAARWAHAEAVSHSSPISSRFERSFRRDAAAGDFEKLLEPLARRLVWQRLMQHGPRALLVGAIVAFSLTLFARLFGLPGLAYLALPFALLVSLGTVLVVAKRGAGPFEVARRTDASLGLHERIATALELTETGVQGPIAERQVAEALTMLRQLDPRDAFPAFAPGSRARVRAQRSALWGGLALALALLLVFWPSAARSLLVDREGALALADPSEMGEEIAPRFLPDTMDGEARPGEGVSGLTNRPDEFGDLQGLLGQQPPAAQGSPAGEAAREARRDAADQASSDMAQRQQALDALGDALRQSQVARQAGEALRSGDTNRAAQQLNQVAEQLRDLSPGERQALAQAFQQAAQNIGSRDPQLSAAAQRAAQALQDFRNQDAQRAINDAAQQVQEAGRQIQEQQALADRQEQMQSGGQPNLPTLGQQQGQGSGQPEAGQRGPQAPSRTEAGGAGNNMADLASLEAEMRNGDISMGGGGRGSGGGTSSGSETPGAPTRLSVAGRTVMVDAEVGQGPSTWRPPNPNAPPAVIQPPNAPVAGAPASSVQVASGLDVNAVPQDLADPVRAYFTPEQAPRP
ncbi:MAG TPA: hypothetical protein VFN74_21935 [Chloroflexota bacterium]|nr:hypothetical protein [Chloroflexota bacterium]